MVFGRIIVHASALAALCLFGVLVLQGCSAGLGEMRSAPVESRVRADWDDVDAAVDAACLKAECAVVSTSSSADQRRYELVTIRDEPGELVVSRDHEHEVRIECRIGRFGDDARARVLADAVRIRLAQLRGVDVAPIR